MRAAILIVAVALTPPAWAADPPGGTQAQPAKENFFKRAAKAIGRDAKAGWNQAREGVSKTGKDVGHGTVDATKRVGREMKDSAKRTGEAAKQEFK
jgi:hypothetical protein